MAKTKRKPAADVPGDFTDAIRAGDGWQDVRVVMMPGETRRHALNTPKKICPAIRWGWLTQEQQAMLVLFAQAGDDAGYGRVRSALCPPSGEGAGNSAEKLIARRERYAAMRNACSDQVAMMFTVEALHPPDRETFDQTAKRLISGGRDKARVLGMWRTRVVADDLLAWRAAGERLYR